MKISELMKGLQNTLEIIGDVEVLVEDTKTKAFLEIKPEDLAVNGNRFLIKLFLL
jgi:hypothetical protein